MDDGVNGLKVMNICFLCRNIHKNQGGIETFVREFSKALCGQGHTVHIIASNNGALYRQPWAEHLHLHSIDLKETPFPGYWRLDTVFPIDDIRFALAAANKLEQIKKKFPIDIVEVMDYHRQGFGVALNKKTPMFLRLHGWVFNRQDGRVNPVKSLSIKERFQWHLQQKCIKEADGIAAVSKDFADFAQEIWKFDQKAVRVIHNAVNADVYRPVHMVRERAMIFAARLAKIKGVTVLAEAMADVAQKHPDVKIYFAGPNLYWPEEKMTAQEFILSKVLAKNVVFLGEVSSQTIIGYYQKCMICVLPSIYEPFGITALEAMASGCVLIASDIGGLKEIVDHGQNGLSVPAGDAKALAEMIKRVLEDEHLRMTCSQGGVEKVRKQFSYQKLINQSLDAYSETIERLSTK
jgi:1,4-alpha-glucan branching enzyme